MERDIWTMRHLVNFSYIYVRDSVLRQLSLWITQKKEGGRSPVIEQYAELFHWILCYDVTKI